MLRRCAARLLVKARAAFARRLIVRSASLRLETLEAVRPSYSRKEGDVTPTTPCPPYTVDIRPGGDEPLDHVVERNPSVLRESQPESRTTGLPPAQGVPYNTRQMSLSREEKLVIALKEARPILAIVLTPVLAWFFFIALWTGSFSLVVTVPLVILAGPPFVLWALIFHGQTSLPGFMILQFLYLVALAYLVPPLWRRLRRSRQH